MYDVQEQQSNKCCVGYIQIMRNLMNDTDAALATNNPTNLRFLFKTYADLSEKELPCIEDKKLYQAYVACVKANRQEQARLSNGRINYCAVNTFFVNAANGLNDSLNYKC